MGSAGSDATDRRIAMLDTLRHSPSQENHAALMAEIMAQRLLGLISVQWVDDYTREAKNAMSRRSQPKEPTP